MKEKIAAIFTCGLFLSNTAFAEEINAGEISREAARQAAGENEENFAESVEVEDSELESESPENVIAETFVLKGIKIDSDIKDIGYEEVQHIIEPYVNQEVNINSLKRLALQIKAYCRQQGWLAAVAYLPEQDSTDGTVTLKIASANFGKVRFHNESHLATDILEKVGRNISNQQMVQNDKIENVLYLINEIRGIKARGALIPDAANRAVNLDINVTDDRTQRGIIYVENYGNEKTGRYRSGIIWDDYNIDNRGSRLELSGLISNKDLDNFVADYSWISDRKTTSRLGVSIGRTTYHQIPTKPIEGLDNFTLDAGGHSTDFRFYGTTPVWKTIHDGFVWNYGYKFRDYTQTVSYDWDGIQLARSQGNYYIHTFSLGFNGYRRSLSNDLFNYSFTVYDGYVSPRSEDALQQAVITGNRGNFFRAVVNLDYRKLFAKEFEFHTNFTGQLASKDLTGAEQMTIGGANGVRGYADGDGPADKGFLSKSEVIWYTPIQNLSLSTFFDIGGAGVKSERGIKTIRSWGFEANYAKPNDFFVKMDYARKIGNNRLVASDSTRQRFWFMVGKIF